MKKILHLCAMLAVGTAVGLLTSCSSDDPVDEATDSLVSISAASATTGESGTVQLTVSLDVSLALNVPIPITYSGTATQGQDFSGSNMVTITSGSRTANFGIMITEDEVDEEDETVIISIGTSGLPTGVVLGEVTSVTVTIQDDDEPEDDGNNGNSDGIGDDQCPNDNSTNQDNWDCDRTPSVSNEYEETVSGDTRTIVTNGVPNHDFRSQLVDMGITELSASTETYAIDATPALANSTTSILDNNFRPQYVFGVAVNGVPIDPAPAEPFIFENTQTGEFNWDWVFEPNSNMEAVGLDCNITHLQPNNSSGTGIIHYHGLMVDLPDEIMPGLGSGTTDPLQPVQVGWAADGFPILYRFGPDATGALRELQPSYQLKEGNRPGDGVSEPCGSYTGKYTNDYEFVSNSGDLDECNGIAQPITLNGENFDYYYVITVDFPVISRCLSGTPAEDFRKVGG